MLENFAKLKKYNFWEGSFPDLGYLRQNYLDKINSFTGNKLINVLVGQRRTGKSYLLRQIIWSLITNGVNPKR